MTNCYRVLIVWRPRNKLMRSSLPEYLEVPRSGGTGTLYTASILVTLGADTPGPCCLWTPEQASAAALKVGITGGFAPRPMYAAPALWYASSSYCVVLPHIACATS